jgi:hypothetical protein
LKYGFYVLLQFESKACNGMISYTRFHLLLINILALMSLSVKGSDIKTSSLSAACNTFSAVLHFSRETLSPPRGERDNFATRNNIECNEIASKQIGQNYHLTGYRKKFKRTSNAFSGIKPPIKDLSPVAFNLSSNATYNRPYFLSHLHHFLFLLTPF